jgi:hypothetical protein
MVGNELIHYMEACHANQKARCNSRNADRSAPS